MEDTYLTATIAAALLEVKPQTLYAYVSRGLLRSVREGRTHRYLRSDVERLKSRSDARAGHGPLAGAALRWGEPVLDSAVTAISPDGPFYRGHAAVSLARAGVPFESVAELLAVGVLPEAPARFVAPSRLGLRAVTALLPAEPSPLAALTLGVAAMAARDLGRFGAPLAAEQERAHKLVAAMAALLGLPRGRACVEEAAAAADLASSCLVALGGKTKSKRASREAVNKALILCADHELNVSTFAARIAASAGADLYACVSAALAALSGPRHGGACDRVEALVAEVGRPERAGAVVHERTRRGEAIPGFGHRLYEHGDPRAELLLELARSLGAIGGRDGRHPMLTSILALVDVMKREGREPPTLDVGLVALTSALDLPSGSALAIFALGRSAGWVAHIFEQRNDPHLLRPRARYVGEPPRPAT